MSKERYIFFLDLNGVLFVDGKLKQSAVDALIKLIDEFKPSIVLTTSLRKERSLKELKSMLPWQIANCVIGVTPIISLSYESTVKHCNYEYNVSNYKELTRKSQRGLEIQSWIYGNKDRLGCKVSKFDSYMIIDNSYHGILMSQKDNFCWCDKKVGLRGIDVKRIKQMLNINWD